MRRHKWLIGLVVVGFLALTVAAEAAEQSENAFTRFFRGLFRAPAKTTEKSVGVATQATTKTVAIGTGEVENVGEALTGSKEAAVGIVVEPVKGAATTTYETTRDAVMAPVEGVKEAVK